MFWLFLISLASSFAIHPLFPFLFHHWWMFESPIPTKLFLDLSGLAHATPSAASILLFSCLVNINSFRQTSLIPRVPLGFHRTPFIVLPHFIRIVVFWSTVWVLLSIQQMLNEGITVPPATFEYPPIHTVSTPGSLSFLGGGGLLISFKSFFQVALIGILWLPRKFYFFPLRICDYTVSNKTSRTTTL